MQEKYSVLMSVYHKEKPYYFKQSLDSMIFQSISPDEIVLICDGELTEELNKLILDYKKKYKDLFKIIRFEKNMGLGYALKVGIENCRNEYIARMDTDDISKKDRCKKQLDIFKKNPELGIVGSNIEEINDGKIDAIRKVPENHPEIKKFMKKRSPFNHSSVMFKKTEVLKGGNYREVRFIEDYFLWVDMLCNGTIGYNIQENLVSMRVDDNFFKRRSGKGYFEMHKKLLKYMNDKNIINIFEYIFYVSFRKISSILPNFLRKFLFKKGLRKKVTNGRPFINLFFKRYLKKLLQENKGKSLSIDDEVKWINKINRLTYTAPNLIELGKYFATSKIEIIKNIEVKENDIIAICIEKNDILKLKRFILHHRKLGIDKFVILDNESNDGTIEWLLKQDDVIITRTNEKYSSIKRVAWINRIIAHFGDDRWYLVADSDELLVYNDCENKKIKDVISYLEKSNIIRARAIMIDMYAKPEYYETEDAENYYEECKYFDKDTYYLNKRRKFINICGGPRERVFRLTPCLTKYPLFYFRKKDVHYNSHLLYPFKENFNSDCNLVLKHYKFLPGEITKYRKIAKDKNYYKGSLEYKKYLNVMEKTNKLDFLYKNTCEYENSSSLNNITVYRKIDWNGRN